MYLSKPLNLKKSFGKGHFGTYLMLSFMVYLYFTDEGNTATEFWFGKINFDSVVIFV